MQVTGDAQMLIMSIVVSSDSVRRGERKGNDGNQDHHLQRLKIIIITSRHKCHLVQLYSVEIIIPRDLFAHREIRGTRSLGSGVRGTGKLVSEYGVWRAVGMYGVADRPGAGIWRRNLEISSGWSLSGVRSYWGTDWRLPIRLGPSNHQS